jgi:hypothetical protein
VKDILFAVIFFIPLYKNYRLYIRQVRASAAVIYNRRRKNADVNWAREYLTRQYLEKNLISFREWLRRVRDGKQ